MSDRATFNTVHGILQFSLGRHVESNGSTTEVVTFHFKKNKLFIHESLRLEGICDSPFVALLYHEHAFGKKSPLCDRS